MAFQCVGKAQRRSRLAIDRLEKGVAVGADRDHAPMFGQQALRASIPLKCRLI
jgi:hypothetical protein